MGYRVQEQFGFAVLESTATGRTSDVQESFRIENATVTMATVTADLRTLTSDRSSRDRAIRERGLETDRFPTARFVLTKPIHLTKATTRSSVDATAVGDLTLHGETNRVQISLEACRQRNDPGSIQVVGQLAIRFADYDMESPSVAGFVSVRDEGEMEFSLLFEKR